MELATTNTDVWAELTEQARAYATQFLNLSKASTENTIDMCEVLFKAKNSIDNYEFDSFCKAVGYKGQSAPSIKKYLRIGACAERFRPYLDRLPNTWTTLYEITQLDPAQFNKAIQEGRITPSTLGKVIKDIKGESEEEKTPEARITIILDTDADKALLTAICKEVEALKLEFKFSTKLNKTAQDMLGHHGLDYI